MRAPQDAPRGGDVLSASRPLLRDGRHADFASLWALDQECFPPGIAYSRAELRASLASKRAETIVIEHEGRVLAFVLGHRGAHDGRVVTLDVAAAARRRGLGRRLLVELERRFRAAGLARVQLEVAVDNTAAIAFYERLGYQKTAHLAGYYGPGQPAWKMAKPLTGRALPPRARARRRRVRGASGTGPAGEGSPPTS